jgi:hypothetical protein
MVDHGLHEGFDRNKWYVITGERMERVRLAVLELYAEQMCSQPGAQRDMAQRLEWVVFDAIEDQPNE